MSVLTHIDSIPIEQRRKMLTDLSVKTMVKKGKQKFPTSHAFDVYEVIDDDMVCIPFAYYYQQLGMGFPNKDKNLPKIEASFNISLFDRQKEIKEECLKILNETHSIVISLFTGFGKCHHPMTPILMWDGSVKMAKDINAGDKLIGDDSTPRNVLSICKGRDRMYRITQNKGDSYIVNEPHILSLKVSGHKRWWWSNTHNRYHLRWFDRDNMKFFSKTFAVKLDIQNPKRKSRPYNTREDALFALEQFLPSISDDDVLDISVKDYLSITNKELKSSLKGFKVGVNFPDCPVSIDPYMLGLWLGDGGSAGNVFTNVDEPIIKVFQTYVESIGCKWINNGYNNGMDYNIRDFTPYKTNQWMKKLRGYDLVNNKHIPRVYLVNSRENRLQLLAGLIDTDGYYKDGCYEIVQKNKRLADDILYLIRSLGFNANQKEVQKTCTNAPNGPKIGTYYRCIFSGEGVEQIPCKLVRKQAPKRQINKDALVTAITVEALDEGDYCGFTIDGNHRFLLGDFTVTHNTMFSIYLACKIKLKTIIFANRVIIIDQWVKSIKKACGEDTKIQVVTSTCKIDMDVDFYIINAINVAKRDRNDFAHISVVIADEIHLLCTEKFSKAFSYVFPKYIIGLTATPVRSDGKDRVIELFCGPNIVYKPLDTLFNVYLFPTGFVPVLKKSETGNLDWNSVLSSQCISKSRNELLIDIIRYFQHRTILVVCKRKEHANILMEGLKKYGEDVDCYMGSDKIVNYDCRVLVVTYSKGGVGFDVPKLDMLLVAGDAEENWIQYLGRVFRREWHFPIIVDPVDKFFPLKKHADTRCEIYKAAGGEVKNLVKHFPCFKEWVNKFSTDLTDVYDELGYTNN